MKTHFVVCQRPNKVEKYKDLVFFVWSVPGKPLSNTPVIWVVSSTISLGYKESKSSTLAHIRWLDINMVGILALAFYLETSWFPEEKGVWIWRVLAAAAPRVMHWDCTLACTNPANLAPHITWPSCSVCIATYFSGTKHFAMSRFYAYAAHGLYMCLACINWRRPTELIVHAACCHASIAIPMRNGI